MKIHEYQGKKVLKDFDVPIQDGYIIQDINTAEETIKKFGPELEDMAALNTSSSVGGCKVLYIR